jgi:hypothetical protein
MGPRINAGRRATTLSLVLVVDGAVFLVAALLNAGVHVPLGIITLRFSVPVWQAGVGEVVIGLVLVMAGLTRRRWLSWTAFALSIAGIAFGLSSHRVVGAARDVHVVLVPLAVVVMVLLLGPKVRATWRRATLPTRQRSAAIAGMLAAVAFATASVTHVGVTIPLGFATIRDPFPGAVIPEAVIAVVLAIGAGSILISRPEGRVTAFATTAFAVLGTVYGLTITVPRGLAGDIAYHIGILVMLLVILGMLFPTRRRSDDQGRSR